MDKHTKLSFVWIILALMTICVTSFGISKNIKTRTSIVRQERASSQQLKDSKAAYLQKKNIVNKAVINQSLNSNNDVLKSVAEQNVNNKTINQVAKRFFTTYYTWSDYKSYMDRANKLQNIITPELKNNKSIFDDGKDSTGGNYLKNTGIQSEFDSSVAYLSQSSDSTAQALVKVVNTSWYAGQRNNSGQSTRYYDLTYNLKNHKISDLKQVLIQKDGDD